MRSDIYEAIQNFACTEAAEELLNERAIKRVITDPTCFVLPKIMLELNTDTTESLVFNFSDWEYWDVKSMRLQPAYEVSITAKLKDEYK